MRSRKSTFCFSEPRQSSGLFFSFRTVVCSGSGPVFLSAVVLVLMVLVSSCGGTAPRFRVGEKNSNASKGVEESRDDKEREMKAEDADRVLSGARTFKTEKNTAISNLDQARMMREISKMMGVPYRLGGADQDGVDCSAYTMLVYKNSLGKQLARTSMEQYGQGSTVSTEDLKFGDLVFFNTTGETASHVGIYLGDDLFAHASTTLGVTISSLVSPYYKKRYEGARRVIE
ncbi:MAG: hypothetical protein FJ217_03800 [Ignavibacteria bacterium]|nr:hypothetical protein [Ignavibacteria bacterium]